MYTYRGAHVHLQVCSCTPTGVYQMCTCTPTGVYQMCTCTPTGVYQMCTCTPTGVYQMCTCTPTGVYQMCTCTPTGVYEMYRCTCVDVHLQGYSNQQPHLVMCLNPLSTDIAVHGRSQTQEGATADSFRDSHSWMGEQECQR